MKFSNDSINNVNMLLAIAGNYGVDTAAEPAAVLELILSDEFSTKNVTCGETHFNNHTIESNGMIVEQLLKTGSFQLGNYNSAIGGMHTHWHICGDTVFVVQN